MLNLIASVVATFVSVIWGAILYLKGPVAAGAIVACIVLAFPAESYAAVIQCNSTACPPLSWWSLMPLHEKAAIILFFGGLIIGNLVMLHDRKVTAARLKKEEQEWNKKYHS